MAEVKTWVGGKESALSRGSVRDAVGTRYASSEKVRRVLGYHPRVDFVDAVRLACEVSVLCCSGEKSVCADRLQDYKRILVEEERRIL
jgi:hypothetical protein